MKFKDSKGDSIVAVAMNHQETFALGILYARVPDCEINALTVGECEIKIPLESLIDEVVKETCDLLA